MRLGRIIIVLVTAVSLLTEACGTYFDVDVCYYRPNSSVLRDTYSDAWVNYQFTLDVPVGCNSYFWTAVGIHIEDGSSEGNEVIDTWYRGVPVTLGAKYYIPCSCIQFYGGLGLRYFNVRIINCSGIVDNIVSKAAVGGAAVLGARLNMGDCLSLNTFVDYSFNGDILTRLQRGITNETSSLEVDGLLVGAGVSFCF